MVQFKALKSDHARFKTGAIKTSRHKLLSLMPFRAVGAPAEFAVVPTKLDIWGNSTYGDCVSAEEAFAKAWWSVYCGLDETFATEAEVVAFASQYGYLNGADLTEVMDTMAKYGMSIGNQTYKDGGYKGVDYSDVATLQSSLTVGSTKIAIDADALPSGAGNQQGWYAQGGRPGQFANTDHCVGLGGYGSAGFLFDKLKLKLPTGLSSSAMGYHLFTWSTIGFVDQDWVMSTVTEAYVRNPTTVGQSPAPSPTPVPVPPVPVPPVPPTPVPPSPSYLTFGTPYAGTYKDMFGVTHKSTFQFTQPKAGWAFPDITKIQQMIADILALIQSSAAVTVEDAVQKVIQDAIAGNYGPALMELLAVGPAAMFLYSQIVAMVKKWQATSGTKQFRSIYGETTASPVASEGELMALMSEMSVRFE